MRNSELGRVITSLSLVVLLTVAILVAVVVEANWGGRGLVTVAAACTPTPTPTQSQTPSPGCGCISHNIRNLEIISAPQNPVLFLQKQDTPSNVWKGAIQTLFSVEDWDEKWDMEYWCWWPELDAAWGIDAYKYTFSPEVNVTQAGEYNVQVTVDDFPTTFSCPHGIIKCFDDPSTSTGNPVKYIVTDVGIDMPDCETYDYYDVVQVGNSYVVELLAAEPASRVIGYYWSAYNGIFQETGTSSYYNTSATNPHIIPQFADAVCVTCEVRYFIEEANVYHSEYASIEIEAYEAVLGLYADDSDNVPGVGVGHSWWELSFNPGNLDMSVFIPEQDLVDSLGVAGFWSLNYEPIGPGDLRFGDQSHVASGSYQWYISLSDLRAALGYVAGISPPNVPGYNVLTQNCTDVAIWVGEHAGIATMSSSGPSTPDAFSNYLNSLYQ